MIAWKLIHGGEGKEGSSRFMHKSQPRWEGYAHDRDLGVLGRTEGWVEMES